MRQIHYSHNPHAILVETTGELERLCQLWKRQTFLALDTEFERTRTFFARPALLQVSDGAANYLLDPLAIADLTPFFELLDDRRILKILHAAGEDLELLHCMGDVLPRPLFDTQIGAAFLDHGFSIGYRRLVMALFGDDLPKQETRSDWLRRPLSAAQREYAALDVAYLPGIYARFNEALSSQAKRGWVDEECERLLDNERYQPDFSLAYKRISQAWRLGRRNLAVLRALCAWREQQARKRDVPRGYVLGDDVLLELSKQCPLDNESLKATVGLSTKERKRSATALIDIVRAVLGLAEDRLPDRLPAPLNMRPFDATLKRLKQVARSRAEALGIAVEILAQRRALEALIAHRLVDGLSGLPSYFRGWREAAIGNELLLVLETPAEGPVNREDMP